MIIRIEGQDILTTGVIRFLNCHGIEDEEFHSTLQLGVCHGLTLLWLTAQCQPNEVTDQNSKQIGNSAWFDRTFDALCEFGKTSKNGSPPTLLSINTIDAWIFIYNLIKLQSTRNSGLNRWRQLFRSRFTAHTTSSQFSSMTTEPNNPPVSTIFKIKKEKQLSNVYCSTSAFDENYLREVLSDESYMPDNTPLVISLLNGAEKSFRGHALGLIKKNNTYYYREPNGSYIETTDINDIVNDIFQTAKDGSQKKENQQYEEQYEFGSYIALSFSWYNIKSHDESSNFLDEFNRFMTSPCNSQSFNNITNTHQDFTNVSSYPILSLQSQKRIPIKPMEGNKTDENFQTAKALAKKRSDRNIDLSTLQKIISFISLTVFVTGAALLIPQISLATLIGGIILGISSIVLIATTSYVIHENKKLPAIYCADHFQRIPMLARQASDLHARHPAAWPRDPVFSKNFTQCVKLAVVKDPSSTRTFPPPRPASGRGLGRGANKKSSTQ